MRVIIADGGMTRACAPRPAVTRAEVLAGVAASRPTGLGNEIALFGVRELGALRTAIPSESCTA